MIKLLVFLAIVLTIADIVLGHRHVSKPDYWQVVPGGTSTILTVADKPSFSWWNWDWEMKDAVTEEPMKCSSIAVEYHLPPLTQTQDQAARNAFLANGQMPSAPPQSVAPAPSSPEISAKK